MAQPFEEGLKGNLVWGANFYNTNCATCHGAKGDGQGPRAYFIFPKPRDFTHPASLNKLNRPELFTAVAKGSLGTEMPAWEKVLNPQQIADLSEFVFVNFIQP